MKKNTDDLSYILDNFTESATKVKINSITSSGQIILYGSVGTHKSKVAKLIANMLVHGEMSDHIDDMCNQIQIIQFHPLYRYQDFVRGSWSKSSTKRIGATENKIFMKIVNAARRSLGYKYFQKDTSDVEKRQYLEDSKKYVLIIEEINRANLPSVFGELIYALQNRDELIECIYEGQDYMNTDLCSKKIMVPSNLYIIGTIHSDDIDKHLDFNMQKIFNFIHIKEDNNLK